MAFSDSYNDQVFINCPFDKAYLNLYRACIFTIIDAGFIPRCSREVNNGNKSRLDNIVNIIEECKYGIHDLSRVELDGDTGLPRFNMPFELGIFYGSHRFGEDHHKKKCSLILEKDPYRYQKFISDISGIDVTSHKNDTRLLIISIRDWLQTSSKRKTVPIGQDIYTRFKSFQSVIGSICAKSDHEYDEMSFFDLVRNMTDWLSQESI